MLEAWTFASASSRPDAKLAGRLERRLSGRGTSEVSANLAA